MMPDPHFGAKAALRPLNTYIHFMHKIKQISKDQPYKLTVSNNTINGNCSMSF